MELSAPTELKLTQWPSTTLPLSPICLHFGTDWQWGLGGDAWNVSIILV